MQIPSTPSGDAHGAGEQSTWGVSSKTVFLCLAPTHDELPASGYNFLLIRNGHQTTEGRRARVVRATVVRVLT